MIATRRGFLSSLFATALAPALAKANVCKFCKGRGFVLIGTQGRPVSTFGSIRCACTFPRLSYDEMVGVTITYEKSLVNGEWTSRLDVFYGSGSPPKIGDVFACADPRVSFRMRTCGRSSNTTRSLSRPTWFGCSHEPPKSETLKQLLTLDVEKPAQALRA